MYVLLDADLTLKETASREYDFVNYCCKERMKDKKEKIVLQAVTSKHGRE